MQAHLRSFHGSSIFELFFMGSVNAFICDPRPLKSKNIASCAAKIRTLLESQDLIGAGKWFRKGTTPARAFAGQAQGEVCADLQRSPELSIQIYRLQQEVSWQAFSSTVPIIAALHGLSEQDPFKSPVLAQHLYNGLRHRVGPWAE